MIKEDQCVDCVVQLYILLCCNHVTCYSCHGFFTAYKKKKNSEHHLQLMCDASKVP